RTPASTARRKSPGISRRMSPRSASSLNAASQSKARKANPASSGSRRRYNRGMTTLRIAQVVPCTEAEGPGKRFALWFQGCPLRCPGCCNPEFLSFDGGETRTLAEMTDWLHRTKVESGIDGITLLGG